MRYVVVGTGSVGTLLAARLASSGLLSAAVSRSMGTALQSFTIVSARGRESYEVPVVEEWSSIPDEPEQVALLAVKSQDTIAALAAMRAADRRLPVVCVQNGVDNERQALRVMPTVLGCLVLCPVRRTAPGIVHSYATPTYGVFNVGCWPAGDGGKVDSLAAEVAGDLTAAGLASRALPDIATWKYAKLLSNILNALDALSGWSARSSWVAELIGAEARRCFAAAGISAQTSEQLGEVAAGLADYAEVEGVPFTGSSTMQSLERHEGSVEVDYLNGEIALLGRLHGVPTPANDLVQRRCWAAATAQEAPGGVDPDELLRALGETGALGT
ncbi:MAG TPA: 2-dehydropantoate 2-reductase N-terminal domain-containing protein [Nocardioidaceae bacterium]|nr:2-dehydropantoate 2-reductase N-terminal domain-containing protein [Nocardioidaceae bacterium]